MEEMKVTSIEQLKQYSLGEVVELPGFGESQKFFARLKRPSMLGLVKAGKIPNQLLDPATKLFQNGVNSVTIKSLGDGAMSDIFGVMDVILDESFVEPTYKQIKDAGIELTDEQIMFVFGYTQNGVEQLKSFRKQQGDVKIPGDVQNIGIGL